MWRLKYLASQTRLWGSGMQASEGPAKAFELDPGVVIGSPKRSLKEVTASAVCDRTV